jgi:hypothetical protein
LKYSNATELGFKTISPAWFRQYGATTLDLYSHVIPGMQEDAAAMVDRALAAARDKARK